MPIKPKYSSSKDSIPRASRKFTDREEFIHAFENACQRIKPEGYNILVYYGVGGIGKTSLRKELIKLVNTRYADTVCSSVDFDLPAFREEENALYCMRNYLKEKYKIQFSSFELAYAVYWQKTHPQLKIDKENLSLLAEGGIVTDLVAILGEIPLIGLIPKVTKSMIKGHKYLGDWWTKRGHRELYNLPELEAKDILERLPMYFASDLKDFLQAKMKKCVFFLDTYEALWQNMHNQGSFFARDEWIRELVSQLPEVLWVISGREKIRWDEVDKEWSNSVEQHLIGGLVYNDSKSFLNSCKITNETIQNLIINSSKGVPYYLDLAVDTYNEIKSRHNREPVENDFACTRSEVLDRFLKYLDRSEIETLKILSIARFWNGDIFQLLVAEYKTGYPITAVGDLCRFSFVNEGAENGTWLMHELMRNSLQNRLDRDTKKLVHKNLFDYYNKKLDRVNVKNITEEQQCALKEAFYHGKADLEIDKFYEWFVKINSVFIKAYKLNLMVPLTEEIVSLVENSLGKDNLKYAEVLSGLSDLYFSQGRYNESGDILKKVLEIQQHLLGEEHPEIAQSLNDLAIQYREEGKFDETELLLKRAISIKEKTLGVEDPSLATSYGELAQLYDKQSKFKEAEVLYKRAIEIHEKTYGTDSAKTAITYNNLACFYDNQGNYAEAESLLRKAIDLGEKHLGKQNPETFTRYNNLACLLMKLGRLTESETLLQRAIEAALNIYGPEHPETAAVYNNLANLYGNQGELEKAVSMFKKAVKIYENQFGSEHIEVVRTLNNLASIYRDEGKYKEAENIYTKVLDITERTLGEENILTAMICNGFAITYLKENRNDKAESLLERANIILGKTAANDPYLMVRLLIPFASLYTSKGDYKRAEHYLNKALEIRDMSTPEHPEIVEILEMILNLHIKTGNEKEARIVSQRINSIKQKIVNP